ncbi:hypothetical protein JYQ62_19610 [Nostoc sp. UHCC 0702]|nr:hypothetical protein JYQ62_19610 [Nostoc sp. UHCC 0702]
MTTYLINPDKEGELNFDDWHEGFSDCSDKKFPQHLDNQAYIQGWCKALGMEAGYQNIEAFLDCKAFVDGYEEAQYECHCDGNETLLNFED